MENPAVLQGHVSLNNKSDHVRVELVESAPFNKGQAKAYAGVAGNLFAFACKLAFERGHAGNVAFVAKTRLILHYQKTLGATHFGGHLMILDTVAGYELVKRYFKDFQP